MMADFVTPRHSAVMERLRRRIELFRQHHNRCETRYDNATHERMDLERQQTLSLHQRLLQTKAKRASKHRQPQPSGDQASQRAPGAGGGGSEPGEGGGTAAEQSRNSTLIALQERVKRKLDSAGSPPGVDPVNGFNDGFPPSKKASLDNGTANGSPLDSKLVINDSLNLNGAHRPSGEPMDGSGEPDFPWKELKQEPEDILPIMPQFEVGNNNLFPDLNLNEQDWKELMEDFKRSLPIEDIQKILEESLEDRKDPLELALASGGAGAVVGGAGGLAGGGGQSSQSLLPDLTSVKAEFSPASAVFEQDPRTSSPLVRSTSSGPPPHPTSSPVASSSASSPVVQPSPLAPPSRPLQPPLNHLMPPGPLVTKDVSRAQQLKQMAAQNQRAQQHKQPQMGTKFHNPPPWPQMSNSSQSPSLYPPDFTSNSSKQLLMPSQPNKGSPKSGAGSCMQGSTGHPNMLGSLTSGHPLSHPSGQGTQVSLNFHNTRPLSHYEAGPGPPRAPNAQNQDKTLGLVRPQQPQSKPNGINFLQHIPHSQDQNTYPAPPHGTGPVNTMTPGPNNMVAPQGVNALSIKRNNAVYSNKQAAMAAALKQQQHQMLEQQYVQRQLMAEQEKQRQQEQQQQQLQRHLTRPPPQYQDQPGPPANQNPFPQQPVSQFTASSQPMSSVGSMGGPTSASRMFPQNQNMIGMNMDQGGGPGGGVAPTPAVSQADIGLPSCGGGGASADGLYNNMNLHQTHPPQQVSLQCQALGPINASFRQNILQQHLKPQASTNLLKHSQLSARMPNAMQGSLGGRMGGPMQGAQSVAWQQQLSSQTPVSNAGVPPNAFSNPSSTFHMQQQQARIPKMPPGSTPFASNAIGRGMATLNPGQQMMQTSMAATQQRAPPNPQNLGQSMANQQQPQQQQANKNQAILSDMAAFGQPQTNGRHGLPCNQGYQVNRSTVQQQQQVFGYNVASGSFAAESDLVDSLLKSQSTQEWMADLDELLASHP
ncbi:mastermind-like protein 1 isoform X1 [Nothobranchius furzeri]|uniref:Mastermind-like 1 n=2 Tax=Nothobranchius furzeri TaxID=105023 RepID=A0A1A8VB71_NOTFU|nr:mastermind-like protein 1 isoform X1 [Nothobranchius furzeri]KAF7228710.1 transcript variant X1 [Nothobranchius furzeri]